jgi:hypothetical protein
MNLEEENKKLKEIILYLIDGNTTNEQLKTDVRITKEEEQFIRNLINKKFYRLNPRQKREAKFLLSKLKNRKLKNKLKQAILYVEDLERKYNRFLNLEKERKRILYLLVNEKNYEKYQILKRRIGEIKSEKEKLREYLKREYSLIKKQLKTGNINNFQDMHLDFIIYTLKEDHLKDQLSPKKKVLGF